MQIHIFLVSYLSKHTENLVPPRTLDDSHCLARFIRWYTTGTHRMSVLSDEKVHRENRNIKDHHKRILAAKYELRRNLYKALVRDPDLPSEMRESNLAKLAKLPRNSSFTRIRNRCIFSGRPRGVYELFRMSRIVFRSLASKGMLNGIKKASW